MESIINNEKKCLVCGTTYNLHLHHIFEGTGKRKVSEQYGCWCYLCAKHHNMSDEGVHFNKELDLKLKSDIKRKVRIKQNTLKQKISSNLSRMNQEVKLEHEILNKYQKTYDKKLNYLEKHKEIEKAWKKSGINNLATRNPISVKQPTESSSNTQENKK